MRKKKPASAKKWVDPDEAPELTKDWFESADLYDGATLVRRGRPKSAAPKQVTSIRLDADVLDHYRATGRGWQTRINQTLRKAARLGTQKKTADRD